MSAVAASDLLARLDGLQVQYKVVEHEAVANGQEWRKALEGKGVEGGWELTKTLLFKPKTAKSATPTPVLVVAREATETTSSSIARLLNLKELRLANEDLIKDVIPGIGGKDDVSPLPLPSPLSAHLHVLLDSSLAAAPLVAAHTTASSSTVLLSGADLVRYVRSLQEGGEGATIKPAAGGTGVRDVDFAAIKSEDIAEKPLASAGPKADKVAQAAGSKMEKEGRKADAYELAIAFTKEGDFSNWYSDVLIKGDMLDYYDVSGCYILKPWSYTVWQHIQNWFDGKIKELGVEDCYFPMFVSNARLEKEKDHIEGFAPEVAWVTKAGTKDLDEPIAIRPTSETVMYPYYAKWIRSYRDLPLKLNQWNSVVRWEFKNPQPFLRTREFLWQEGHTAFLTKKEADDEVMDILDLYRRVYEELLAVPVIPGVKSENEKFAGGLYTTTVEGFVPATGRGIQGATSHCLGQNFSKMFDISVEDPNAAKNKAEGKESSKVNMWQNSWGLSTRSIGVMVMVHGDDQGLVMPPRVSNIQVVIVPVGLTARTTPEERQKIETACSDLQKELGRAGVRAKADLREGYTPGWKFNDWELRGVPVRLEIGPRDLAAGAAKTVRRYDGHKEELSLSTISTEMPKYLEAIQEAMFQRAKKTFDERVVKVEKWEDVVPTLDAKNAIVIPWCEGSQCEDDIKAKSARISLAGEAQDEKAPSAGAKSLCIPFDQGRFGELEAGTKCVGCGEAAKRWTMFGRSY